MKNRKKFLVIDLEATCWEDSSFQQDNSEIIEIGVALIDFAKRTVVDKAQYLIKPKKSKVSEYCTNLTGITQEKLDKDGIDLMRASKLIRKRFSPTHISWGGWGDDYSMLKKECEDKKAVFPFNENYNDLGFLYSLKKSDGKKWNLKKALIEEGLEFKGSAHSGVDDAFNTARLFIKFLCGELNDE